MNKLIKIVASFTILLFALSGFAQDDEQPEMSFFITSVGGGDGGNLGGLAGADAHCQALASAVGAEGSTWRAYLSTQGPNSVDARDRIGTGPWHGPAGHLIARDLNHLHGDTIDQARLGNGLHPFHARTEKGDFVPGIMAREYGVGASEHDILTGSTADGRAYPDGEDQTCSNWTNNSGGSVRVGHHDRHGFMDNSWNSTHNARGCSQEELIPSGGAGLLYCFARD